MASMTVARFRGTLVSAVGPASATVSSTRPTRISAVGRCRTRLGPLRGDLLQQLEVGEPQGVPPRCGAGRADSRRPGPAPRTRRGTTRGGRNSPGLPRACAALGEPAATGRRPRSSRACGRARSAARRRSSPGRCAGPAARRPHRRSAVATSARCSAAAAAKSARSCGVVETSLLRPVSGSSRVTRPTAGSSRSRGSVTSTASRSCRPDSARSERSQLIGAEEVGDDDGQTAAARRPAELLEGGGQVAALARRRSAGSRRAPGAGAADAAVPPRAGYPGRCRAPVATTAPIRLPPPPVRCADRGGRGDHQVALLALGGAEVQRCRQVGDQPGLQLAVGHGLPDVRLGGAGRHRPVHPADVVARVVRPGVAGFGAGAGHQAEVVALQQSVESAPDGEFQGGQRGVEPGRVGVDGTGVRLAHRSRKPVASVTSATHPSRSDAVRRRPAGAAAAGLTASSVLEAITHPGDTGSPAAAG